jgi:hypothetical protein
MKTIKDLFLFTDPEIETRAVLLYEKVEDKNKKQFVTTKDTYLTITFTDCTSLILFVNSGYKFDGATIPFNIGKGNMKLLIPALFHDTMCDDKSSVNYDRHLSSLIFRELLVSCGVSKIIAQGMYLMVETYQKFFCDWSNKNE